MVRGLRNSILIRLALIWMRTWRIRWPQGRALPRRGVLALWHGHLPACIAAFAGLGVAVLISRSADGSHAAEVCGRLGYRVFRGSTSSGGLAGMKALARALGGPGESGLAGMALDGPRGPRHRPKEGSLWLSGFADAPLHPIAVVAPWSLRLGTWDRCLLPLPFARIEVKVGPPVPNPTPDGVLRAMRENQDALEARPARVSAVPA
jgi:lysophospholipid acyltransferase (LPLAT)-like uncharacterized protein